MADGLRWSELLRSDPERLEIELAEAGTTLADLADDLRDVPEKKAIAEGLSIKARQRRALEWFGDQGNPQPEERTEWFGTGRTPDWGHLPRLEDDGPAPLVEPKLDERTERWRIPTSAYWYILEQRVKNGEAVKVNWLSEQTRSSDGIDFVGRKRVQRLTDWIDANPERARRGLELHDTPPEFRATSRGVLVPRLRNTLR
jgi:hypothetical protein